MSEPLAFMPFRTPMVDLKDGRVSREWYLYLVGVFERIGGATGSSNTELAEAIGAQPPVIEPPQQQSLFEDSAELSALREEVAALRQIVDGIQQEPPQS